MDEAIKSYWNSRAAGSSGARTATTNDIWLRELEIRTIARALADHAPLAETLLDAGCGDGYSTVEIARRFSRLQTIGVDYSHEMIALATARLADFPGAEGSIEFRVGDVTDLASCVSSTFDIVLTDRCLINLETPALQGRAVESIANQLAPGGVYLAIENFQETQEVMNAARRTVGLPEIPVRWHNLYLREREFLSACEPFFNPVALVDFASSYYFATRVVYSKMCEMRNETPDYDHEVHRLAVDLPPTGQFSPVRMAVLRRRSAS